MTGDESPYFAADLVADYRPGSSFFFASPRRTLLAEGSAVILPGRDGDLPAYVAGVLGAVAGDLPDPVVVGAVPFDRAADAYLVVPETVQWGEPVGAPATPAPPGPPTEGLVRPVPEPEEYVRGVERALLRMSQGDLSKVVLARSLHVTTARRIDVRQVLRNLSARDPRGYTFAADLPSGRVLIGASPELLVQRVGTRVVANPLAGSVPRSPDPVEDGRRAAVLRNSTKDRHEHAVVVDAVVEALRPYLKDMVVPLRPAALPTAAMWHLSSRIIGELADPAISALELATALHPTPAICGTPVEPARAAIAELEPFPRGFYAGMVGWVDAAGDGEWVVTIRSGEVEDRSLRLYAGAGIVAGSQPEEELAETSAKFRTLLHAMGMGEVA